MAPATSDGLLDTRLLTRSRAAATAVRPSKASRVKEPPPAPPWHLHQAVLLQSTYPERLPMGDDPLETALPTPFQKLTEYDEIHEYQKQEHPRNNSHHPQNLPGLKENRDSIGLLRRRHTGEVTQRR